MSYDRYTMFRGDGIIDFVPGIQLDKKDTDYFETYYLGRTRLDVLSNKYYGDPNYDWLIMLANQEYGSMEFEIPDLTELRIPYPLNKTIEDYTTKIRRHKELYG